MAAKNHRTRASSGPPSTTASSSPLTVSSTKVRGVVLLKPKRSSMTKVEYHRKGSPRTKRPSPSAPMKTRPVGISPHPNDRTSSSSHEKPPANQKARRTARSKVAGTSPNRVRSGACTPGSARSAPRRRRPRSPPGRGFRGRAGSGRRRRRPARSPPGGRAGSRGRTRSWTHLSPGSECPRSRRDTSSSAARTRSAWTRRSRRRPAPRTRWPSPCAPDGSRVLARGSAGPAPAPAG